MRIVIAEDSPETSLIIRRAVESLGHQCRMATDGVEAWDLFQRTAPQMVISDWMMPNMDGRELCRRIRESERPTTYFIFLTRLEDRLHFLQGERAGADAYLTKPVQLEELRFTLEQAELRMGSGQPASSAQVDALMSGADSQARRELLQQLAEMGSRLTTRVTLNGRSMMLDAALTLIEQLPPTTTVGRRWPEIWITPDPFLDLNHATRPPRSDTLQRQRVQHEEQTDLIQQLR